MAVIGGRTAVVVDLDGASSGIQIDAVLEICHSGGRGRVEHQGTNDLASRGGSPGNGAGAVVDLHRQRAAAGSETAAAKTPLEAVGAAGSEAAGVGVGGVALIDAAVKGNRAVVVDAVGGRAAGADAGLQRPGADRRDAGVGVGPAQQQLADAGFRQGRRARAADNARDLAVVGGRTEVVVHLDGASSGIQIDGILQSRRVERGRGTKHERSHDLASLGSAPGERSAAAADVDRQRAAAGSETAAVGAPLEAVGAAGSETAVEGISGVALIDAAVKGNRAVVVDAVGGRAAGADAGLQRPGADRRDAGVGVGPGQQQFADAGFRQGRRSRAADNARDLAVVAGSAEVVVHLHRAGSGIQIDAVLEVRQSRGRGGTEQQRSHDLASLGSAPGERSRAVVDLHGQCSAISGEAAAAGAPLEAVGAAGSEAAVKGVGGLVLIDAAVEGDRAVVVDAVGGRSAGADAGLQRPGADRRDAGVGVVAVENCQARGGLVQGDAAGQDCANRAGLDVVRRIARQSARAGHGAAGELERADRLGKRADRQRAGAVDRVTSARQGRRGAEVERAGADGGRAGVRVRSRENQFARPHFDDPRRAGDCSRHDGPIVGRGGIVIDVNGAVGTVEVYGVLEGHHVVGRRRTKQQRSDDLRADGGAPRKLARVAADVDGHRVRAGGKTAAVGSPLESACPTAHGTREDNAGGVALQYAAVQNERTERGEAGEIVGLQHAAIDVRCGRVRIRAGKDSGAEAGFRQCSAAAADDAAERGGNAERRREVERSRVECNVSGVVRRPGQVQRASAGHDEIAGRCVHQGVELAAAVERPGDGRGAAAGDGQVADKRVDGSDRQGLSRRHGPDLRTAEQDRAGDRRVSVGRDAPGRRVVAGARVAAGDFKHVVIRRRAKRVAVGVDGHSIDIDQAGDGNRGGRRRRVEHRAGFLVVVPSGHVTAPIAASVLPSGSAAAPRGRTRHRRRGVSLCLQQRVAEQVDPVCGIGCVREPIAKCLSLSLAASKLIVVERIVAITAYRSMAHRKQAHAGSEHVLAGNRVWRGKVAVFTNARAIIK